MSESRDRAAGSQRVNRRCLESISAVGGLLLVAAILAGGRGLAPAQINDALSTVYAFSERVSLTNADGAFPRAALLVGADGSFYGTAFQGGAYGYGTVFRFVLPHSFTALAHFAGTNGRGPAAPLIQGKDGGLYGTTQNGGAYAFGTVFRVATNGPLMTLYSFTGGNDGAYPVSGLVQSADGALYGTAQDRGTNNHGTAFRLTTNGVMTRLLSFNDGDGASPRASLLPLVDDNGNFFGTTHQGGDYGAGTVFKMTPQGNLIFSSSFGYTNGNQPDGALVRGADGNFYGTTRSGGVGNGTNGYGTVFRMTLAGGLTPLAFFDNQNGNAPESALLQARDGNFYGTSLFGSVFKVTTNGTLTKLVSFVSSNSIYPWGLFPKGSLVEGPDGNLYGVTEQGGGTASQGTIYRINLRPSFLTANRSAGECAFMWSGIPGQSYRLQYTTNLTHWLDLGGPLLVTNATMNAVDLAPSGPRRFYRLLLVP